MVQSDKAVGTSKLMLLVNIIFFSTPAGGSWSLVQESGGEAIP